MLIYRGYSKSFEQHGFPEITEVGNNTVIMGAQVETWSEGPGPRLIKKALRENKDLTMVAITLGGNDVMWNYEAPEPYEVLGPEATRFMLELDTIIDLIEAERPELDIMIVGYDYPNMVEPLLDNPLNPYWDTYIGMNYPTPEQLNLGLQYFEKFRMEWPRIKNDPKIHFLYACGLMQYTFGQDKPVPIFPYDPYPAFSVPFPNGDPRYPSPQVAMGLNGFDTYHLGPEGFKILADHHLHTYMLGNLRGFPDAICNATLKEESGHINEYGFVRKGQISAGRNNKKDDVRAIISIATESIPDNAVITSASLFLTRQGLIGDPFLEGINPTNAILDMKSGNFGTSSTLAKEDYAAPADAYDIACMVGNAPNKNYTLRFDILPDYLNKINVKGNTQFRLSLFPEGNKTGEMFFLTQNTPEIPYILFLI
jgi:lysophospholipase L1-like esterase